MTNVQSDSQTVSQWYILRVVSNKEDRAIEKIKYSYDLLRKRGIEPEKYIKEFSIPKKLIFDYKNGKRVEKYVSLYPGYLFVKMIITPEIFHFLQTALGSLNILKKPMSELEYQAMLNKATELNLHRSTDTIFVIGDRVKIMEGTLKTMYGSVIEINNKDRMLKVSVAIFGRATEIHISFDHVKLVKSDD